MERESNFIENPSEGSAEQYVALPAYESVALEGDGVAPEDVYNPDRDGELGDVEQSDRMISDLVKDPMFESPQIETLRELGGEEMEMIQEINSGLELRHGILEESESESAVKIARRQAVEDALSVPESSWADSMGRQWKNFKRRAHAFALAGVAAMGVGMETAQAGGLGAVFPPQEQARIEAQIRREMGRHAAETNVNIPARQRQNQRNAEFQQSYNEQVAQANRNYQRAVADLNAWQQSQIAVLRADGRNSEITAVQVEYRQHLSEVQSAYREDVQRIRANAQYSREELAHRNRVEQIISGAASNAIYRIFAQ